MAGDHYIQAALMGRWGEPPARSARELAIAVRMMQPTKTFQTTPENVGKENSLYPAWLEKFLPSQGERFIISDRGLCEFGDLDLRTGKDWPSHGVFFPLGPALPGLEAAQDPWAAAQIFWFCVWLVRCLPPSATPPCGQSRVISAGRGVWNRGGR